MMQLLKNVRLTASTAAQHLTDDPVLLLIQISRRLPSRAVSKMAQLLVAVAPHRSTAAPVLLATLLTGDGSELRRRLKLAAENGARGTQARSLADIALAADEPQWADTFLRAATGSRGVAAVRARRYWHDGSVSDAISVLDGSTGASETSLRARLAGEAAVLRDAAAKLAKQEYTPVAGRVLHLLTNSLPHTASGYAQRSHSILLAQQQTGWDVLAVTRLGYPVQVGKVFARGHDVVDGVRYRRLIPAALAATADARLQQQADALLQVALEFKPSVLHTTTHYTNGLVVRAVAESLGIPWVYEVRGQLADTWASTRGREAKNSERYRLFKQREAEVMLDADLVVTLGRAMKLNIVSAGIPSKKVIVAPNAVGGDFLKEPVEAATARRELGLPEAGQYIGTVSSLVPYEGIDDLIGAFALLAPDHPQLRLLIVGGGASLPSLQNQAKRSGFDDRITFTGRVPRSLTHLYHQALDIFVLPRKDLEVTRSVTPLKPVEALACARPVLASELPALAEIVTHGTNGLLARPGDRRDFAAKLDLLLGSEELRTRLGQAGRLDVLHNRTWGANASALAVAYEDLTEATP